MPVAVVLVNRILNDRTPLLQAIAISIRKTKIEYRRTVSALKFLMLRKGVTENGNRSSCWDSEMLPFDERDGHNPVSLHQIGGGVNASKRRRWNKPSAWTEKNGSSWRHDPVSLTRCGSRALNPLVPLQSVWKFVSGKFEMDYPSWLRNNAGRGGMKEKRSHQ